MFGKASNTYHFAIQVTLECYKTHKTCDKAASRYLFAFIYIPDWYKTQEICNSCS